MRELWECVGHCSQVFTRLRLAALCLRWNPAGDTFAIGSSERLICICHRDKVCPSTHMMPFPSLLSHLSWHAHAKAKSQACWNSSAHVFLVACRGTIAGRLASSGKATAAV